MLRSWVKNGSKGSQDTVQDTARLALHVLSVAGFGVPRSFNEGVQKLSPGHDMSYQDALSLILRNVVTLAIIPKESLTSAIFPKNLRKLGQAAKEFKRYMEQLLENERTGIAKRESSNTNLLSALIRASDEAKQTDGGRNANLGLSDEEIYGNVFIYNLAGHETTANTVATSVVLLAAYPECQKWLAEEINSVLNDKTAPLEQKYDTVFPRLNRCLAIMVSPLTKYICKKGADHLSTKPSGSTAPSSSSPKPPASTPNPSPSAQPPTSSPRAPPSTSTAKPSTATSTSGALMP